jgi:hypothetical protein
MICCIKGCELPARAMGMCTGHYSRVRDGRDLAAPLRKVIRSGPDIDRLKAKVSVNEETGCWMWTASVNTNGYGQFRYQGRPWQAHRASWLLHNGDIPEGLYVLHRCDTPLCVNPDHLFLGSQSDNLLDAVGKNRWNSGRLSGEEHGRSLVNEDDVRAIRASTETIRKLAAQYGISVGAIQHIRKRRSWQHVE